MSKVVKIPNVAKSIDEAKGRLKKSDKTKVKDNTLKASVKRGL